MNNNEEEYITINLDGSELKTEKDNNGKRNAGRRTAGKRTARIDKNKKEKKPRKKWSKKKIALVVVAVILLIAALIGVVLGTYVYKAEGDITQAVINIATDIVGNDKPIFVLVLGISEDITSKLTDTIILAGYNPETQKAFMLSIPRDTFVGTNEATASGWDKINALYQKDITKTIKAVEERTGINIDKYVVVRNTMLPAIVNAIGEVEFDVPIDMDYDDPTQDLHIHLEAGVQMINGDKAEQLLRFRHNNDGSSYPSEWGDNDYGRMRTQREFIKAVAKKLVALDSTTNLKAIAEAVFANLETNMSITDAIGYIPYALKFNVDDIRMEQLPGSGAMLNKLSFYKASHSRSKKLMDELVTYLGLDEKETKQYYTGKIKQTIAASGTQEDEKDECAHNYTSSITTNPTCKDTGVRTYTCTLCSSSYTETVATTGNHNYASNGKCSVCGIEKKPTAHECKFTVLKDTILEPNCIDKGEGVYACTICGNTANLTIKATGKHSYGTDGKCTTSGCTSVKEGSSDDTGTSKPEEKPETPEKPEAPETPTTCAHSATTTVTTPATCVAAGSTVVKCTSCNTVVSTTPIPATGAHTNTTVTTPATCVAAGSTVVKCTVCGNVESTTSIPATGQHNFVSSNQTCTNCSEPNPNYQEPEPEPTPTPTPTPETEQPAA